MKSIVQKAVYGDEGGSISPTHGLVSVVVAVFNGAQFVEETLMSITRQTYTDLEVLVVDDCSTDDSVDIVTKCAAADDRIRMFSTGQNSGPARARNIAITESRGRFIAICDADDTWSEDKLLFQIEEMKRTNAAIVGTSVRVIDANGDVERIKRYRGSQGEAYQMMLGFPPHSSIVFDLEKLPWPLLYDETFLQAEDYKAILDYSRVCNIEALDNAFINYRVHGNNLTKKKFSSIGQVGWAILARVNYELGEDSNISDTRSLITGQLIQERIDYRYARYQEFKKNVRNFKFTRFRIEDLVWALHELVFKQDPRLRLSMKICKTIRNIRG